MEEGSDRRGRRWLRPLIVAIAVCVIAFCGWAIVQYAVGSDPVAWLTSQDALQTTEESGDADDNQAADDTDASSDQTVGPGTDAAADADEDSAEDGTTTTDGSDISTSSDGSAADSAASSDGSAETISDGTSASSTEDSSSSAGSSTTTQQQTPIGQSQTQPEQPETLTVSVTVDGSPAGGSAHTSTVEVGAGATVYDALVAADTNVNARDTVYGVYVAAIDGLAEKEHGSMSGWVYAVNGVEPNTACSNYVLSAGDSVVWTYVNVE